MSDVEDKKVAGSDLKEEQNTDETFATDETPTADSKDSKDIEKEEEVKLRSKYEIKGTGQSALLQKRLSAKGPKYFDSGDYNMAKAKMGSSKQTVSPGQKLLLSGSTGDAIPTPESVPHKKISINQSKLAGMS